MDIFRDYYSAFCRDFLVLVALKITLKKKKYLWASRQKDVSLRKESESVIKISGATFLRNSKEKGSIRQGILYSANLIQVSGL